MVFLVVDSSTGDLTHSRSPTRGHFRPSRPHRQLLKHGLALTALTGPLLHLTRTDEAAALPLTAGCAVLQLNRYYGRLRRPPGQHSTSRGHRLQDATLRQQNPQAAGPGRASPVPAATPDTFRAPYAGEFFTAALPGSSPLPWPSPRFREARHSLARPSGRLSNDAAGFASCY